MEISGLKRDVLLPVLAAFSVNACVAEQAPSNDTEMTVALETLDQSTNQLALSFEAALKKAMITGETYSEQGNPDSGVLLVDGDKVFGCIDSIGEDGKICETSSYKASPTNPSELSIDRNNSTLVYVTANGEIDMQVVSRGGADKPQNVDTMLITDKNCGINSSKNGVPSSAETKTPSLVEKCVALRDGLRKRLEAVMKAAIAVKPKS
jgi:hypothetical protein